MKKLISLLIIFIVLVSSLHAVFASGGEIFCYLATEETRENLGDSIGASSVRFLPVEGAELYETHIYKDGTLVSEEDVWASVEDDYGIVEMTDAILENGNGSYTVKVMAVDEDSMFDGDGRVYTAESNMSNPYIYTEPAFTMEPVTNVCVQNGEVFFDHNAYGVKATYQVDCYIEYGDTLSKKFIGHQRFTTGVKKEFYDMSLRRYADELERNKEKNPELVSKGTPKLVFAIYAKAWDINQAKQSPVVYFYPNGEKPTYTEGIPTNPEVIMTTSTNIKIAFGSKVSFLDAYNINGNNYLKLRDLAYELTLMGYPVDVVWDEANNAINLVSGKEYTIVGGERKAADGVTREATPTNSSVYVNDVPAYLKAYNIGGNNYFKLRDICASFNISVNWDEQQQLITVDHTKPYKDI